MGKNISGKYTSGTKAADKNRIEHCCTLLHNVGHDFFPGLNVPVW